MSSPKLALALVTLVLGAACARNDQATVTPSPDGATDAGPGGSVVHEPAGDERLPCEVAAVLQARCQSCHRQPGLFGAPMPLLTWADTQASAPSGGGKVWQMMKTKL